MTHRSDLLFWFRIEAGAFHEWTLGAEIPNKGFRPTTDQIWSF
jgi:hypothetical protein